MENIKFIAQITEYLHRSGVPVGNCIYYTLGEENRAKAYCDSVGVVVEIINKTRGLVDSVHLPFDRYFDAVQCYPGAPFWYQNIEQDGKWHFDYYPHVLPKVSDYERIAGAINSYLKLFE